MDGSMLRTTTESSRTWKLRPWPNDSTVAHLVFVDHAETPTAEEILRAVEQARSRGARAVRTSALFPSAAAVVSELGFDPIDRLALLSRPITAGTEIAAGRATRPMMAWHHAAAAAVDRAAFGPLWGNDSASLRDIRRATPRHRARIVRDGRTLAGFVIAGAAGGRGYLQRLAVSPLHRRAGHASTLVADVLGWMRSSGLTSVLVNTGTDNHGALSLYEGFGFRRLDSELTIAELRLESDGPVRSADAGAAATRRSRRIAGHREPMTQPMIR